MKFYSIVKICHKIITLALIVLFIIQCQKVHSPSYWRGEVSRQEDFISYDTFSIFILIWLYFTGILIAIKAIISFKKEKFLSGIVLLIISFIIFILSKYILLLIFSPFLTFIY